MSTPFERPPLLLGSTPSTSRPQSPSQGRTFAIGNSGASIGAGRTSFGDRSTTMKAAPEDDIFDQMISDTSFGPPSNTATENDFLPGSITMHSRGPGSTFPATDLSIDISQSRPVLNGAIKAQAAGTTVTGEPLSAAPSTLSSRRGSFESAGVHRDPSGDGQESGKTGRDRSASSAGASARSSNNTAVRSFGGSAQNAVTDAEIGFSTHAVVRPAVDKLKDLQIHVHGIQMQGHKSRVETQIRMRIELVRPSATAADGGPKFERIGSFSHLKLPPLSGTKRHSKKYQRGDVDPRKTLFFDATVVNATPPHDRIFVCAGCMQRERKRLHRKKRDLSNAASAVPATLDGESVGNVVPPSAEEMRSMGFDPALPGAQERALQQMLKEDRNRVVVFNCGDYVDFPDGETILPTRITCYCRHHKAKVGFCIIFTMRDWQGRLLATGSTPPIMITDDHKTQAANRANGVVGGQSSTAPSPSASGGTRPGHSRVGSVESGDDDDSEGHRQTSPSSRGAHLRNSVAGVVKGVQQKAKKERKKPYDDAGSRRRANGSGTSTLVMTPFYGGSPAASSSTSASAQDASSLPAATPQQVLSNSPPYVPLEAVDAGSLSPSSLLTNPHSVPDFNLEFLLQQQGLQLGGGLPTAFSWPQLDTLNNGSISTNGPAFPSAQFPIGTQVNGPLATATDMSSVNLPGNVVPQTASLFTPIPPASGTGAGGDAPTGPIISKLIPGEGPTSGGIEVTVLGQNFEEGITCVFGDVPATNTKVWAANTLVCILPPSQSPGPVVVTLKGSPFAQGITSFAMSSDRPLPLFTYTEASDRALMELALQVVGLQMTGAVQSARDVALRVVGSGHSLGGGGAGNTGTNLQGRAPTSHAPNAPQSRDAVSGLISNLARGGEPAAQNSFQDSILNVLSLLDINMDDVPGAASRPDAIRLSNKQGHTLLHLAVMLGFHRLASNLLRRGAPVNARDRNGYTALHFAALHGRVTIARLLLNGGARDNIPNWEGQLPIDIARDRDQIDVEMLLADTGSPAAEVHLSASHLDSGVSISERDEESVSGRAVVDAELSDQSLFSDTPSDGSDAGNSRFGDDSALLADDEREMSGSSFDLSGAAESDDGSATGSAGTERTARRAPNLTEPGLALRALLTRAGDSVAAMEWAQRLHMPGTMDALQARLGTLHLNMPSLPVSVWPLARNGPREIGLDSNAQDDNDAVVAQDAPAQDAPTQLGQASLRQDQARTDGWPASSPSLGSLSSLGNIAEWANALFNAPPPTYEDALASRDRKVDESMTAYDEKVDIITEADHGEGTSASPSQPTPVQPKAERLGGTSELVHDDGEPTRYASSSAARNSSPAAHSKLLPAPDPFRGPRQPRHHKSTTVDFTDSVRRRAVALTHRRVLRRSIYDDAMLFWFWIPALVAVLIIVFLSSGDGVLSLRDLLSYFDLEGASSSASAALKAATSPVQQIVARGGAEAVAA